MSERFEAHWTPTVLVIDPAGIERHRIEGFLPAEEFLSQLKLGLGHSAFSRKNYEEAERIFREIADHHSKTEAAPEALYWAGASKYSRSHEADALRRTSAALARRYHDSSWTKRSSVWAA